MAPIDEKMRESHLRWLGRVQSKMINSLVRRSSLIKLRERKEIKKDLR